LNWPDRFSSGFNHLLHSIIFAVLMLLRVNKWIIRI